MSIIPRIFIFTLLVVGAGCVPAGPSESGPGSAPGPSGSPPQTLVITGGRAPDSLASKPLREVRGAGWPRAAIRALNAGLAIHDERELARPYLVEALPQLHTDAWRVLADGQMEVTFRLRPGLSWHDGAPLVADDVVFAWRVYSTPEFGLAASPPLTYMDQVRALDPRTLIVVWRQPFAEANDLQAADLPPLPRHLLQPAFLDGEPDAFVAHPFWLTEYVGAGPYRLMRYELGAFLEAEAFAGHALGRPRIERVRLQFSNDPNTALAQLLADAAHVASADTIDLEQATVLEREWVQHGRGSVLRSPVGVRHSNFQLRAEYARPRTLLDVRVRRAVAHATDREALAQSLTEGQGTFADALLLPQVEYFSSVERAITKYPYDLRRAEELFQEVGYARGPDGLLASAAEGRFSLEVAVAAGARNDNEVAIMADSLRKAGIDTSIRVIPRAQISDRQFRTMLPGILNGSHGRAFQPPLQRLRASEVPSAANRWQGSNHTGWTNPEMERLIRAWETTLDRSERNQYAVAMLQMVSQDLPIFPLYYSLSFMAHAASVRGPLVYVSDDVAHWNLHEWHWGG